MKSKHIFTGLAALAVSAAYTSCSHDFDDLTPEQQVIETYNNIFIENFGKPAANQDWGFGAGTRGVTRAADMWDGVHSDDWFDLLQFEVPSTATKVTATATALASGTYYITKDFSGTLKLVDNFEGNLYVETEITNYEGNIESLNLYILEKGSWKCDLRTGSTTIYNNGYLYFDNEGLQTASKVPVVYNGGILELKGTQWNNPNIADAAAIYSNSTGLVEMTCTKTGELDNVCLKCTLDIHGKMKVNGNLKVQNGKNQYVCDLEVTGTLDITQGNLHASNIKADNIKFDGAKLWLLAGGHVTTNKMTIPNGGCYIYGVTGSNGLVEVGDIIFQNDNDFNRSFSDNIFFKVTGTIDCSGATNLPKGEASKKVYNNADAYLEQIGGPTDRLNAGNATGSPACGQPWSIGTPTPDDGEEWDEWVRIIAEDLSVRNRTDFDFNDVVFDARINKAKTKAQIKLKAAGGTLPLTVGWSGDPNTSYSDYEVHNMYGVATNVMVNTQAKNGVNGKPDVLKTLTGTFNSYNDIKVMVQKMGEWMEIKANTGEPAAKILVKTTYEWCKEREPIGERYPKFLEYVRENPSSTSAWYENQ